jgi:hypothetical protein
MVSLPLEDDDKTLDRQRLYDMEKRLSRLSQDELLDEIRTARLSMPRNSGLPDSTELLREDRNR